MKLIKQGKNECFLATIAMVKDLPLEAVREMALFLTKRKKWSGASSEDYELVRKFYDLPPLWAFGPSLKGKGTLYVQLTRTKSHIVAFEDGVIYDSSRGIFYSFSDFYESYNETKSFFIRFWIETVLEKREEEKSCKRFKGKEKINCEKCSFKSLCL